jgi:hypothetical protein
MPTIDEQVAETVAAAMAGKDFTKKGFYTGEHKKAIKAIDAKIAALNHEITTLMALKAGHILVVREAEKRRTAAKHKYHSVQEALHDLLQHNGWNDEEESDFDFMGGEANDYATITINLLEDDGFTDKEIARMAYEFELKNGYFMFYDYVMEHGTKKQKKELRAMRD